MSHTNIDDDGAMWNDIDDVIDIIPQYETLHPDIYYNNFDYYISQYTIIYLYLFIAIAFFATYIYVICKK